MKEKSSPQEIQDHFFGKEALIFNARRLEIFKTETIDATQIKKCFISLNDPSTPIKDPIQRLNYFSCLLYYQSFLIEESKKYFSFVENKLQANCELNQNNLFLICNIIEIEDRFKSSVQEIDNTTKQFYEQLLSNLSRFEDQIPQYNILVLYYKALLYLMLKRFEESEKQIQTFNENIKTVDKKIVSLVPRFLEISSSLLNIRIHKMNFLIKKDNLINFEKEVLTLFSSFENKAPVFAFKLGNQIVNFYLKKADLEKCENMLTRLKKIIPRVKYLQNEEIFKNLYVNLIYKSIYCYSIQNKTSSYMNTIDKINEIILSEKQNHLKLLNTFMLNSYMLDTDKNVLQKEKINEQIEAFKSCYFQINKSSTFAECLLPNFLIIYNNLFALNYHSSETFKKIVFSYIHKIQNEDHNILCGDYTNQYEIVNRYIYIYNLLSFYINQYLDVKDQNRKNNLKKKIVNIIASLLSYVHKYHNSMASLQSPLIMNLLITLYSIYLALIENESFDKFIDIYKNKFVKELSIPNDYKGANGLIEKAIADNYFKKNNFNEALEHYKESLVLLGNVEEEYRTGTITFNMGICYLMLNNKEDAVKQLEASLVIFTKLRDNASSGVDMISKISDTEFFEKKIKHVNDVLAMI